MDRRGKLFWVASEDELLGLEYGYPADSFKCLGCLVDDDYIKLLGSQLVAP
jgi:hypothetical protein